MTSAQHVNYYMDDVRPTDRFRFRTRRRGEAGRPPRLVPAYGLLLVCLLTALVSLTLAPSPAHAERYVRSFSWSGYKWKVRLARRENPMRNNWWDHKSNVRVRPDGKLRLAITRAGRTWRSVEVASARRLGYGRYRWTVNSDLSSIGPHTVFALFTDDNVYRSPYGEQVFEFGRWGIPQGDAGRVLVQAQAELQQLPDRQPTAVYGRDHLAPVARPVPHARRTGRGAGRPQLPRPE